MGVGDEILGSGMARRLHAVDGRKVAFGDGQKIVWSSDSELIYHNNPKIAKPGEERFVALGRAQWVKHYRGSRLYGSFSSGRLVYNSSFKADRGEFFFSLEELRFAADYGHGFVVIEPRVKAGKGNKQWLPSRFSVVAAELDKAGHRVVQFVYGDGLTAILPNVEVIRTPNIRYAAAVLARAAMFVGSEGGLHHAAAAVEAPAVVLFGGFIHPRTTGYEGHVNIFTGGEPCGRSLHCNHCAQAMDAISVDQVLEAINEASKGILATRPRGASRRVPGEGAVVR